MKKPILYLLFTSLVFPALSGEIGVIFNRPVVRGVDGLETETLMLISSMEISNDGRFEVVDREKLQAVLEEMALGAQSVTTVESSPELGRMTGASYLINTRLIQTKDGKLATVQCIDMETSRTKSGYVTLEEGSLPELGMQLGALAVEVLSKSVAGSETAKPVKKEVPSLPDGLGPVRVSVWIPEQHINQPVIDPAAENEIMKMLLKAGFTVPDLPVLNAQRKKGENPLEVATKLGKKDQLDYLIYGEAISERSDRLGAFEGARARVEVKVVDVNTGNVVLAESGYAGAVDAAESTAAKMALQKAGHQLSFVLADGLIQHLSK